MKHNLYPTKRSVATVAALASIMLLESGCSNSDSESQTTKHCNSEFRESGDAVQKRVKKVADRIVTDMGSSVTASIKNGVATFVAPEGQPTAYGEALNELPVSSYVTYDSKGNELTVQLGQGYKGNANEIWASFTPEDTLNELDKKIANGTLVTAADVSKLVNHEGTVLNNVLVVNSNDRIAQELVFDRGFDGTRECAEIAYDSGASRSSLVLSPTSQELSHKDIESVDYGLGIVQQKLFEMQGRPDAL